MWSWRAGSTTGSSLSRKIRTYARPSRRRKASTPDIPRPSYMPKNRRRRWPHLRSCSRYLRIHGPRPVGQILGAIASYSLTHDVPRVRVVFCDAATYDQGYMSPHDALADSVKVHGRGGTVLQPAIDLLERAADFPPKMGLFSSSPTVHVTASRHPPRTCFPHPKASRLPFIPRGPVFRIQ